MRDEAGDPGVLDRFLYEANSAFSQAGICLLVLFDAPDRVAASWEAVDLLATALLRTILQFSISSQTQGKDLPERRSL